MLWVVQQFSGSKSNGSRISRQPYPEDHKLFPVLEVLHLIIARPPLEQPDWHGSKEEWNIKFLFHVPKLHEDNIAQRKLTQAFAVSLRYCLITNYCLITIYYCFHLGFKQLILKRVKTSKKIPWKILSFTHVSVSPACIHSFKSDQIRSNQIFWYTVNIFCCFTLICSLRCFLVNQIVKYI